MSTTAARVRGQVAERDQADTQAKAEREEAKALIRQARGWFTAVVPPHVNADQFVALALGVIQRDPQLTAAAVRNPQSFMVALAECARLGLVIGDTYHLTWFRNRETGVPDIVGMTDYKGEIQMIYNAGSVAAVHCQVVRRGGPRPDRFRWQPGMTLPEHVIADDGLASEQERGPLAGVYAYATLRGGGYSAVIVMSRSEVAKHREVSKTDKFWGPPWPDEGPWTPDMWAKGLAVDTPLPTPGGWTTMGAVHAGDTVLDKDGQPARVIATSEVKQIGCYRITFRNGHSIICDEDHRWLAVVGERRPGVYPVSALCGLAATGNRIMIPATQPLDLPSADLPVDPWLLGYWLGDGDSRKPSLTCHDDDLAEVLAAIRSAGYEVGAIRADDRSHCCRVGIRGGVGKQLAELGILGNKHIPAAYLRGSARQRLALLRGLMDSDGTTWQRKGTAGRATFVSTSRQLRDGVAELARSLGQLVLIKEHNATGFGKTVRCYTASWTPTVMSFTLGRKVARSRVRYRGAPAHSVRSIERVESVPTRCIAVDSPTATYLAGPDMIPTHNTALHKLYDRVPHSAAHQAEMLRATTAYTQHAPAGVLDLPDGVPPPIPPPDYAAIMAGGAGPPPPADGHAPAPREQPAGLRARQDAMTQIRQRFESAGLGGPGHAQTRLTLAGIMANPDGPPLRLSNPGALDLAQAQAAAATLAKVFDECAAQGRDPGEALKAIAAAAAAQQDQAAHDG